MNKVVFVLSMFLLGGCGHMPYRIYDYDLVTAQFSFGSIYVETLPATHVVSGDPDITELSGPYTFRIVFLTDGEAGKPVQIQVRDLEALGESARLTSGYNNTTQPDVVALTDRRAHSAGYISVITDANTMHEPLSLSIEISYEGRTETVTVNLVPRYREQMRGGFGDLMRSV